MRFQAVGYNYEYAYAVLRGKNDAERSKVETSAWLHPGRRSKFPLQHCLSFRQNTLSDFTLTVVLDGALPTTLVGFHAST